MKRLSDITYKRFQCGFCSRIYKTELGCSNHEVTCYKNPKRNCKTCKNTGWEDYIFYRGIPENMTLEDVIDESKRETRFKPCTSCQIATTNGGKSYIEIKV